MTKRGAEFWLNVLFRDGQAYCSQNWTKSILKNDISKVIEHFRKNPTKLSVAFLSHPYLADVIPITGFDNQDMELQAWVASNGDYGVSITIGLKEPESRNPDLIHGDGFLVVQREDGILIAKLSNSDQRAISEHPRTKEMVLPFRLECL